jgi:hypothetical protein
MQNLPAFWSQTTRRIAAVNPVEPDDQLVEKQSGDAPIALLVRSHRHYGNQNIVAGTLRTRVDCSVRSIPNCSDAVLRRMHPVPDAVSICQHERLQAQGRICFVQLREIADKDAFELSTVPSAIRLARIVENALRIGQNRT